VENLSDEQYHRNWKSLDDVEPFLTEKVAKCCMILDLHYTRGLQGAYNWFLHQHGAMWCNQPLAIFLKKE